MADLRALCAGIGWDDVQTYIQSGNVVVRTDDPPEAIAEKLEHAVGDHFGFSVPVIVRTAEAWAHYTDVCPFPEHAESEPNRVMLGLSKNPIADDAEMALRNTARGDEKVARVDDGFWFYFANGVATTKITPALLDRAAGSPVTLRNWKTVLKLGEMAGG
jgi:uncharacterized protein (DUF1697 family)